MQRSRRGLFTMGVALSAVVALALPAGAGATPISQTFNSDSQGWQGNQGVTNPPTPPSPYFDPWLGTAGNPGGGLAIPDSEPDTCVVPATDPCAAAFFLSPPDLPTNGANYGGSVSFDFKASVEPSDGAVVVSIGGTGSQFVTTSVFASGTAFRTYSIGLTESPWTFCNPGCGPATRAQLTSLLQAPSQLFLNVDRAPGTTETYSVDNVRFTDGPPTNPPNGNAKPKKCKKKKKGKGKSGAAAAKKKKKCKKKKKK